MCNSAHTKYPEQGNSQKEGSSGDGRGLREEGMKGYCLMGRRLRGDENTLALTELKDVCTLQSFVALHCDLYTSKCLEWPILCHICFTTVLKSLQVLVTPSFLALSVQEQHLAKCGCTCGPKLALRFAVPTAGHEGS